jgi:uncharacterized protein DUF5666
MLHVARWVVLAGALAAPGFALAHEGGNHAKGTVHEITADRIVVTSQLGKDAVFTLAPETTFERGNAPARREDVKVGERVVVHGKHAGNREVATIVKLAPAARRR